MAGDETWDEGTDLLSRAVTLALSALFLALALAVSGVLRVLPLPRGRRGPAYCQARTSCVQATHGCACTPDNGGKP